jgi:hypothetical protein
MLSEPELHRAPQSSAGNPAAPSQARSPQPGPRSVTPAYRLHGVPGIVGQQGYQRLSSYRTSRGQGDANAKLVEGVYAGLRRIRPEGVNYATF